MSKLKAQNHFFGQRVPLVSCIVPTRNRVKLLMRAITSIISQTVNDLEIIVIDDASSDSTQHMVQSISSRKPIRYLKCENQIGGGGARNLGIEAAKGTYIAFLDDDDEWLPQKLEKQLRYIEDYGLVGTKYRAIQKRPEFAILKILRYMIEHLRVKDTIEIHLSDILIDNCGMSPSSVLLQANSLREIGGFDASLAANQGRDLFIRFIKRYGPALLIEDRLVLQHREHDYHRISESAGKRFDAFDIVHEKYHDLMPTWVQQYDKARIALLKSKVINNKIERKNLHLEALSLFSPHLLKRFLMLYTNQLISMIKSNSKIF
jgi:glycosyltransferase involved in cell wall biosynthesis